MPHQAYTIVESPEVTEVIAKAVGQEEFARVEETFDALKWRISRQPKCGDAVVINGLDYFVVINAPVKAAKNCQIVAAYRVNDDIGEIIVERVKLLPYDAAQAYSPPAFDLTA